MQSVLEFDPPLPETTLEEKYSSPEIYLDPKSILIGGDDRFETDAPRWKWSENVQEVDQRLRWLDAFLRPASMPKVQVHFRSPK
jgi:hypothetical protein